MKVRQIHYSSILTAVLVITQSFNVFSQAGISNDGKYVFAQVSKTNNRTDLTLVVQSTEGNWKREVNLKSVGNRVFSSDSKNLFYQNGDTLNTLELGTSTIKTIPDIKSFRLSDDKRWLLYEPKDVGKIVVKDLQTNSQQTYGDVISYAFDHASKVLMLIKKEVDKNKVCWVDLKKGTVHTIWSGKANIANHSFDETSKQLAFIVQEEVDGKKVNSIWLFQEGKEKAEFIANNSTEGIDTDMELSEDKISFNGRGDRIFFTFKEKPEGKPIANPKFDNLEIWSYLDPVLQSQQQIDRDTNLLRNYAAAISLPEKKIVRVEQYGEVLLGKESNDYAMVCKFQGDVYSQRMAGYPPYLMNDFLWNKALIYDVLLVSLKDGSRKLIKSKVKPTSITFPYFAFSSSEHFAFYYDEHEKNYFSYEILTGKYRNVTYGIKTSWILGQEEDRTREYNIPTAGATWLNHSEFIIIQDHYSDLWKLDLAAIQKPVCVSNHFAQKSRVKLQVAISSEKSRKELHQIYYLISQRDLRLNSGYCSIEPNKVSDPNILLPVGGSYDYSEIEKAGEADVFILRRVNENEPYNYCWTRDFNKFEIITSNGPERRRGVKQRLLTWKTLDGNYTQGVLEFPENFDSTKKYPVILTYYERHTEPVTFKEIEHEEYTTRWGYLTLNIDIKLRLGEVAHSVYNCVVSGAKFLSKLPFVDSKKMGITGQSFGGYHTANLVTHTGIFAAAFVQFGFSDLINNYLTEEKDRGGFGNMAGNETGQNRMGITLWDRPDIYMKNSPIFYADKVTTPVLICDNRGDSKVTFSQGMEFFKALRRLGKRAWLLASPDSEHGGPWGQDGDIILAKQFLDHYLKGAPAPVWMTRGVPAKLQGTTLGTEYDTEIKTPGLGLLMENEDALTPRQKELLRHKTTVNNQGRIVDVVDKPKKTKTKNK